MFHLLGKLGNLNGYREVTKGSLDQTSKCLLVICAEGRLQFHDHNMRRFWLSTPHKKHLVIHVLLQIHHERNNL